jgi:hypothetical protein
MRLLVEQLKFFFIVILEFLFFPFAYFWEWVKNKNSSNKPLEVKKVRKSVVSHEVYVNIHEWGGYSNTRIKKIKSGNQFTCGLKGQLERFSTTNVNIKTKIYLTISDIAFFKNNEQIEKDVDVIVPVSNNGMDFSGYSEFYNLINNKPNAYVILSNTSVNIIQTEFLADYIAYMEMNPDVGILGVSYCSKIWQSLIRNNFNPHLQSFFLLTTINVLEEIVAENGGKFPGKGILYKRLLIKKGEIAMSKLTQKIGYNLAVTLENGTVFKFGKNGFFDNGYNRWKLKYSDVRLTCVNPNIINEIQND